MTLIQTVYAAVPDVPCKGLCQEACGPIGCSDAEATELQNNGISLPSTVDHPTHGPLTCSHLSADGRCRAYEHRPLICRLFGAVKKLQCPHGCRPKGGFMSEVKARQLMAALDAATGRPPYLARPLPC